MTLLLLTACSESGLKSTQARPLFDSGLPVDSAAPPDSSAGDSADDSGDVLLPDTGTPCEGGPVSVPTWTVGAVEPDPERGDPVCTALADVDFTFTTLWTWSGDGFVMNPVIAPNHGASWASVFVDNAVSDEMVELDGRDGAVVQAVPYGSTGEDEGSTPAVGDTDGDGAIEFVRTKTRVVQVVDGATSAVTAFVDPHPSSIGFDDEVVALADVDLDGAFDIVKPTGTFTLAGTSFTALTDALESTGMFVSDLDGDGLPEVVNGAGMWSPLDGTGTAWDATVEADYSFYGAPVDVGDGSAGVLFTTGRNAVNLAYADGTPVWTTTATGARALAAMGDTDGDGLPELCTTSSADGDYDTLVLLDTAGNVARQWTLEQYATLAGGCSMADLDADGIYEILFLGYTGFRILDGRTGDVLASDPSLSTDARDSAPEVADVDGDGSADIVLAVGDSITVLSAANGRWARTRKVWNQLPYDITSIANDGSLVSLPRPSWSSYHAFRAQPSQDGAHPDLALDVAASSCDPDATLVIDVRNQGSVDAPAGVTVTVSTLDGTALHAVATTTLADPLPAGDRVRLELELPAADLGARWVVDVDSVDGDECDLTNNRVSGIP